MRLGSQPPLVSLPSSSLSSVLQGRETDMFSCVITQGISRSPWCSASLPCTLPSTITEGSLCELSPWAILPNNTKNHQSFETAIFLAQTPDHTSGLRSLLHSGKEKESYSLSVLANAWILKFWDSIFLGYMCHFKSPQQCSKTCIIILISQMRKFKLRELEMICPGFQS